MAKPPYDSDRSPYDSMAVDAAADLLDEAEWVALAAGGVSFKIADLEDRLDADRDELEAAAPWLETERRMYDDVLVMEPGDVVPAEWVTLCEFASYGQYVPLDETGRRLSIDRDKLEAGEVEALRDSGRFDSVQALGGERDHEFAWLFLSTNGDSHPLRYTVESGWMHCGRSRSQAD